MTAVAITHRDQIIKRVAAGEYLATIARDLGLQGKGQSISDYLANDPDYRAAREFGLEAKLACREAEVESARDPRDVPRARELLSHARWRAERECPQRWGQRVIAQPTAQINITIGVVRDGYQARVVADVIPRGIVAPALQFDTP